LDVADLSLTTQTMSSTLWQHRRRGWAAAGRISALTWGNLTRFSASLSEVVAITLFAHPISSVWRLVRDLRHFTNKAKNGPCAGRCTFKNLHWKTRISCGPRTKEVVEVLHAAGKEHVCAQSIRDGLEFTHNLSL